MYCTLEDLEQQVSRDKLVELTADADDSFINVEVALAAIADAGAEIDAFAATQYKVPLNPPPLIISKVAVDIALYNLFSRRGFDLTEGSKDYNIYLRYKQTLKFLEMLSHGDVKIGAGVSGGDGSGLVGGIGSGARIENEPRVFTRQYMKGY